MSIPKRGLIIEYHAIFGKQPNNDRFQYISKTTKCELIGLLCYINAHLSPRVSSRFDYTQKTQIEILRYLLRLESDQKRIDFIIKKIGNNAIVFNRPTNLWAITEILNSNIPDNQENPQINSEDLWNFFQYYLAINTETNKLKERNSEQGTLVENLNLSIVAHNEYFENVDPINTLYRGAKLFNYLVASAKYGKLFEEYVSEKTNLSIQEYLIEIASIYFSDHSKNDEFRFFFRLDTEKKMFETFSEREIPIREKYQLEALHIRKAPFYKIKNYDYFLLDDKLLLEKCYDLLIWDFLFEKILTGNEGEEARLAIIKEYKGFIGRFFELFVKEKFDNSFHFLKYPKPKLFEDLKVDGKEIGDVYLRKNKNILLGEVKSSGIPSKSKYGENLGALYNNNRDKFFKTHGLHQLIQNLKLLCSNPGLYDKKLSFDKKHTIFPIIITNEKALTVGLFIQIFNDEFNKLFGRSSKKIEIKPIIILHISDLEFLEEYFKDKTIDIFLMLNNHYKKYNFITKLSMSYSYLSPRHSIKIGQNIFNLIGK